MVDWSSIFNFTVTAAMAQHDLTRQQLLRIYAWKSGLKLVQQKQWTVSHCRSCLNIHNTSNVMWNVIKHLETNPTHDGAHMDQCQPEICRAMVTFWWYVDKGHLSCADLLISCCVWKRNRTGRLDMLAWSHSTENTIKYKIKCSNKL